MADPVTARPKADTADGTRPLPAGRGGDRAPASGHDLVVAEAAPETEPVARAASEDPGVPRSPQPVPIAGDDPLEPIETHAPDPAGTRPKVAPGSLLAVDPSQAADRSLGETFRVSPTRPLPGPLAGTSAGDVALEDPPTDTAADARAESPHAPRFQFILGALVALGLSAIAITAYTLSSGRDPVPADWSAWHPTAGGIQGASQIANHVAAEYRQPGTGQLLAVKGGPLALAGVPVTIALKTPAAAGGVSVLSGNAVLYKMCGLGPGCTITGRASADRLMLVRREALELALYTFQYVANADQVVVFLPPVLHPARVPGQPKKVKVTTDPTDAVFFRAADLAGELSHPLTSTLTRQTPSLASVGRAPDTALVSQLTSPSFYKFSFVQTSQDASLFLVLEPFAVGS